MNIKIILKLIVSSIICLNAPHYFPENTEITCFDNPKPKYIQLTIIKDSNYSNLKSLNL